MTKIKVVVVDDSAFMRKAIENMLSKESDIEIVGFGKNGQDAVELAKTLRPDVMTLDVEMPRMDGLSALSEIMKSPAPVPVIMVSSLTQEGADITLKALEAGAVDFILREKTPDSAGILKISEELKNKVRKFAKDRGLLKRLKPLAAKTLPPAPELREHSGSSKAGTLKKAVVIGTSTGGPQSLQQVIPRLPSDLGVPVFVVQHMPANFTNSLAVRLNSLSKLTVIEVQGGEQVRPNYVYIAQGGKQMTIKKIGSEKYIELTAEDSALLHNPSVDVLLLSVAESYGESALGIIMTGMGSDGTRGMRALKKSGGTVLAQDESSSIVYGMPKSVIEAGLADETVPLQDLAKRIVLYCKTG